MSPLEGKGVEGTQNMKKFDSNFETKLGLHRHFDVNGENRAKSVVCENERRILIGRRKMCGF